MADPLCQDARRHWLRNAIAGPMDPEIQWVSLLALLLMEKKITGQSPRPSSSSHVPSHTAVNGAVVGAKDLGDAAGTWTDDDKRRDKAAEPRTDQGRAQSIVMAVATKLLRSLSITSQTLGWAGGGALRCRARNPGCAFKLGWTVGTATRYLEKRPGPSPLDFLF